MRFLHLTTFYPPYSFGGDAMYVYRLAHALGDAGYQVDVVHCIDSYHLLHPEMPDVPYCEHPRVRRIELRNRLGYLSPLAAHQTGRPLLNRRRIKNIFASEPYDVVHYHNISLLGPEVLTYKTGKDRPAKLYTTHEHWLVCPMHVLWKYDQQPCRKAECLKCTLLGRRPPQLWRYTGLLERAGKHVDRFISPSRFTAQMHAERAFPYEVGHLPYFMDRCEGELSSPAPAPQQKPYFLFVGRLEKVKGLHTLIEAWRRVSGYDLLVAGSGTEEMNLRARASGMPNVRFLGAKSQEELGALYLHAVACIVPSVTYETFGVVVIEAFARKTPVIVRRLGALPEMVEDSGGGLIYESEEQLLTSVHQLGSSLGLRQSLGVKGYEGFLRWWSREAHLRQYFNLIDTIRTRHRTSTSEWETTLSPAAQASSAHI